MFGHDVRSQPFSAERRTLKVVTAGDRTPTLHRYNVNEHSLALAREWKRLGRAATAVAVLTSPILFIMLLSAFDWAWYWARWAPSR